MIVNLPTSYSYWMLLQVIHSSTNHRVIATNCENEQNKINDPYKSPVIHSITKF